MTARFLSLAGDLDLVVGENEGTLKYMENIGTSTAPAFVARTGSANPFDGIGIDVGDKALGDLDGDGMLRPRPSTDKLRLHNFVSLAGDLDLVVGAGDGKLTYIENTGTPTNPEFVFLDFSHKNSYLYSYSYSYSYLYDDDYVDDDGEVYSNPFDGIDVGWYRRAPALGDLDGDGTLRPRPSSDKLRYRMFRVSRRRS